ncbi:MAG: ParA family protein [Deltaproteobacteria bacterium]|nr:MAG: ParA family protein [Deltaproteobacteria bacterium]
MVAVSNQKGGEGKTTTTVNLAASLAAGEHRVLVVDADPQSNATSALGFPRGTAERGTYEVLVGAAPVEEVVVSTELERLDLLPATPDLAGAEVELVDVPERERALARGLAPLREQGRYDFVFIDCPPSLGLLTINALVAADTVLVPMQAKYFSLEGLSALMGTIERVRAHFNPSLALEGILFCLHDQRTNLARQVVAEVREHFGGAVYETTIPVNIRLSESPSFGKPALLYDITSRGAQAYLALAREFLARRTEEAS